MRDFYATSASVPLDQAEGLRQLFSRRGRGGRRVIALAANGHVAHNAVVLDRVASTLSVLGRQVLVVDAALSAPAPHELARIELAAGLEPMMPGVAYLPARGLPLQYVDTRGSAARFIEALFDAVPSADVVLLHAEAADLARLLVRTEARPLLMAADHPESLKHAYASCKLLTQRTRLATYDLLLAASARSPRISSIVASLRGCADSFLGALVHDWALVDPALPAPLAAHPALAADAGESADDIAPDEGLAALLAAQLALDDEPGAAAPAATAYTPNPLPGRFAPIDR
ncbi:MAG: flagellar biosynthesis protein [Rubrivivax sp.]|nr:flagellar biosynthesis protein [Rubrivivax sp.]MCL4698724.1 flagellar biosynthesis protein [Burkholderiaceae bacterium]